MERIRLTQRNASKNRIADEKTPATLVDLGHEDRNRDHGQYSNASPAIKYETPNKGNTWTLGNKRGEVNEGIPREGINAGIPRMANVFVAAKKATKLAMMLLGDNAKEAALEEQARAFMRMGDKALTASINRWAAAQEDCPDGVCAGDEEVPAEAPTTPDMTEGMATEGGDTTTPDMTEGMATEGGDTTTPPTMTEGGDIPVDAAPVDAAPVDAESTGSSDDLDQVFADEPAPAEEQPPEQPVTTASRKAGIKRLNGGQPTLMRVASQKNELESLWDKWSNPDVR